jgi:hypothetical protein
VSGKGISRSERAIGRVRIANGLFFFIYPLTFIELIDLFVSYAYPFFFISLCIASQTNSDAFNS